MSDVEAFTVWLREQDYADKTVATYAGYARLAKGDFPALLKRRGGKHASMSTVRVMVAAGRAWETWQGRDPDALRMPKASTAQRHYRAALDDAGLERYLAAVDGVAEPARTILKLLPYTAMRISEACALPRDPWRQIGAHRGIAIHGKGDKIRWIPALPIVVEIVDAYLATRAKADDTAFLFPSPRIDGASITPDAVRYHLKCVRDAAGLSDVTPHVLRHTAASRLAKRGVAPRVLQDILGHASINTTMRYVHTDIDQLVEGMDKLT